MNAALLTIAVTLTLSACGGDPAAPSSAAATATAEATVTISRSRFDDVELRIPAGTTVTFVNTDAFDHTVTSTDESPVAFDSGAFGEDGTFEFTFTEPGEYPYFCQIHPTMRAVVIVE